MPISIKIENIFDTHTLTCYCNTSLVRQQPTDYIWSWKKQVNDKIDDETRAGSTLNRVTRTEVPPLWRNLGSHNLLDLQQKSQN